MVCLLLPSLLTANQMNVSFLFLSFRIMFSLRVTCWGEKTIDERRIEVMHRNMKIKFSLFFEPFNWQASHGNQLVKANQYRSSIFVAEIAQFWSETINSRIRNLNFHLQNTHTHRIPFWTNSKKKKLWNFEIDEKKSMTRSNRMRFHLNIANQFLSEPKNKTWDKNSSHNNVRIIKHCFGSSTRKFAKIRFFFVVTRWFSFSLFVFFWWLLLIVF